MKLFIRIFIFSQSLIFIANSIYWLMQNDVDKWFIRWALGMILLAFYGMMKHLTIKQP